jgi:threonine dehydratase
VTVIDGVDAARVREVAHLLAPHIRHTPMIPTPGGGFLKLESLQPTGSFKVRGFFAAAHVIDRARVARGLLTVSAGNAALACAYVARALGVPCRVVMFDTAPALKVNGVRDLGADAVLMPRDRLFEWMAMRAWEHDPEVFIHPFRDTAVITGHASIVPEILADLPDVDRVFVPVGGGGLICGVALGFAALKPDVQVVGVQSSGYPLWHQAFAVNGPPSLTPDTIADGTAAPFDALMFERLRSLLSE